MDKESVLLEFIKDNKQSIRDIRNRIYNTSTAFIVFSFGVTAFTLEKAKPIIIPVTILSDLLIAITLVYIYIKIINEHDFLRIALEKQEGVLIDLIENNALSSIDLVAPILDLHKKPKFRLNSEARLLLGSALIVLVKAILVYLWAPYLLTQPST